MNPTRWANPDLQNLVELFFETPGELGDFVESSSQDLPDDFGGLLNHSAHMTVTLEDFHQSKVALEVLNKRDDGNHYSREIQLNRQSDGATVLYGIVRLNMSFMADEIRSEVKKAHRPLGRILVDHGVLRTVKLLSLWKITPGQRLQKIFGVPETGTLYGRTALIYCNSVPAIELLEIVSVGP